MSIQAVVFDFGKVISFPPEDGVYHAIAALAGTKWQIMEPLYTAYRRDYDLGGFPIAEFYRRILERLDLAQDPAAIAEMGRLDLGSWAHVNPGTTALMEEIKAKGFRLGILSNMPSDFLAIARRDISVLGLPHFSIFSCEAGCVKPDAAIYRRLLSELDCPTESVVFFDDIPANVEGARALGIKGLLWESVEKARRDLAALGFKAGSCRGTKQRV